MSSRSVGPSSRLEAALAEHGLRISGRLLDASNAAFFGWAGPIPVIYKPVRGERPLWDFPSGCLAHRERASHLVDDVAGFGIVPPTVLHDGPAGLGSVQWWVTDPDLLEGRGSDTDGPEGDEEGEDDAVDDDLFALLPPDGVTAPWLPVFTGELPTGEQVVLAHADAPDLRSVAVLDAVLNNSDRKGSHVLRGVDGTLWGIDHGVTLHHEPKLRTVLWGWATQPLRDVDSDRLRRLQGALAGAELRASLADLLTDVEIEALADRTDALLRNGTHPMPTPGWPAVPWPAL